MTAIDEYLAEAEAAKRAALERIRALARRVVADATRSKERTYEHYLRKTL